jgi:predicted Ser/Thr protein kinase
VAIYIDPPDWPGHGRLWSHLVSDVSYEELHDFAAGIGIPRRAFERDHYDVLAERYSSAVRAGARPATSREIVGLLHASGLRRRKVSRLAGSGPVETQTLRHGYTNETVRVGDEVVKRYLGPDAVARCEREAALLRRLAGRLPVPAVVGTRPAELRMEFVPGRHGQELLDGERAQSVLESCGRALRELQRVERGLVHGDFGPQNLLFEPDTLQVTAILDWESAHQGDSIEDLAWGEWIVRMHHPDQVAALPGLFAGYGERPSWSVRQGAMLRRCSELLAFSRRWEPEGAAVVEWQRRRTATSTWVD